MVLQLVHRILCRLGQHSITIRYGVARCAYCDWSEHLPAI